MRNRKPFVSLLWAVLFFFAATFGFNGCGNVNDVASTTPPPAQPGPLKILTPSPLPGVAQNQPYNFALSATGGTPGYTWSRVAGSPPLPTGLTLSPGGIISGSPTSLGTVDLIIKVQDSATPAQSAQKTLSITVSMAPIPLQITSTLLLSGTINVSYFDALTGTGGTTPYTWGLKSGSPPLPSGLSLSTANGFISGTPTVTSNDTHIFILTDATSLTVEISLQLTINAIPLSITTTSLPVGTQNQNYNATTLAASGGTPPLTWSPIVIPALPSGLTFNAATATISGIPTVTSNQTHTFTITDSTAPINQTATKGLLLTIGAAPPELTIQTNSLPSGTVTVTYPSTTLAAIGGTPPYKWSTVGNIAPAPGLTLSQDGKINGTPGTTSGSPFTRTYRVEDSAIPPQVNTKDLTITVGLPAAPNITTTSNSLLPNGIFNVFYTRTLQVQSGTGTPPFVWSFTGGSPFPSWLSLNIQTGVISGTPNATGTFNFNVQVTDNTGQSDPNPPSLSITIDPQAPPSITPFTLPNGTVNQPYPTSQSPNILLAATGGIPPYIWSVTPALPNGLQFNILGPGIISGTPLNASVTPTTHTFRVTDDTNPTGQFSELTRNLTINAALTIDTDNTTLPLPAGIETQPYSGTLAASGGTQPYTWSVDPLTPLPLSLSLNSSTGEITGAPDSGTAGTTSHNFTVQDSASHSVSKLLNLTISP